MKTLVVALMMLVAAPVTAQSLDRKITDTLRWDSPARAARISDVVVAAALVTPCLLDRSWQCVAREGTRVGLGVFAAEVTKRLVHRTRPDGSDDKSFFSEHTTLTCAATLGTRLWALCPAVGYLRVAAEKHYVSDVVTGGAVAGLLMTVTW